MMINGTKDTMLLRRACPFCGEDWEAMVPTEGFEKWQNGMLIQYAMPTVPATTREWLISGICADCQIKVFGE